LPEIRRSPKQRGRVELIVRRPAVEQREVVEAAALDPALGMVGDCWRTRGARDTADGQANPERQLTLMNTRAAALVAVDPERRRLAGDQLFVDFDLGVENLPPGTRLAVGEAVVEITAEPHLGCAKFRRRFGTDALRFVNSEVGRELRLRGVNAKVVEAGGVRTGDAVTKLP
jgi:hypothetical protein